MVSQVEQLLVRIDATTEGLRRELKRTEQAVDGTANKVDASARRINQRFDLMSKGATRAFGALAAAASASAIIKAASSMQQLEARLRATTGSTAAATEAMSLLREMAGRQAVELTSLADGFNRLLPSVKAGRLSFDEMQQILALANDNIKAFGLGASEAQGLFLGLSQVLGSGTVTMEDLRQVTDRLPGSLDKIASALGKDVGQLKAMVATGEFTTEMLKGPLLEAFKANAGAAEGMANTFESAMTNMTNAFSEFGDALAKSGLLDLLSAAINEVANAIRFLNFAISTFKKEAVDLIGNTEQATKANKEWMESYDNFMRDGVKPTIVELKKLEGSARGNVDASEQLTKAQTKLIEKQKEYRGDLAVSVVQQEALYAASLKSVAAHKELERAIKAENEARQQGFKAGSNEYNAVVYAIKKREMLKDATEANIKAYEKEAQAQEDYAKELMQPWQHAIENVQDELAKMFEDGKFNFQSLANVAKKLAAEVAAAWIIRPVLGSLISGSMGGGMTGGAGGTSSGGGVGIGSIGDFTSIGRMLSGGSMGTPLFGSDSLIGGGIDSIGNFLGLGSSNFIGPMPAGQVAPLSSMFTGGAALAGLAGSLLANLFGLGGGVGGSIGGAAGGLIGTAIGGPFGALLGSFAGSALGGLFGKKPSSKLQGGNINLAGGEAFNLYGLTGKKFSQENQDAAKSLLQVGQGIATALADATGKAIKENLRVEVGGRDGIGVAIGDKAQQNYGTAGEALKALTLGIADLADQSSQAVIDIKTAADKIDFTDAEKALTDLAFAAGYSSLGDLPIVLSETQLIVKQVTKEFAEATATATRLGLATEKLTALEKERLKQITAGYTQMNSRAILEGVAPTQLAILDENQRYVGQLKDLKALNASEKDFRTAELLHQIKMQQILQTNNGLQNSALTTEQRRLDVANDLARRFGAVSNSFKDILYELQYGKYSADTPVQNLSNMRTLVQTLATAAAGGNADAAEQLAGLLPAFLELSGNVNGFNMQYAMDRQLAESVAKSTLTAADRQVQLQTSIAMNSSRQIEVLQNGFGSLEDAINKLGLALTVSDVVNSAAGVTSNMLRPGEDATTLSGMFNTLNNLPEIEVRRLKTMVGFDFSTASGSFADWVRAGHWDAGQKFNAEVVKRGGTAQTFAVGGEVHGPAGIDQVHGVSLTDGEFVVRRAAARKIGTRALHSMNNTGQLPAANDGIAAGLNRVADSVNRLINMQAASDTITHDQLNTIGREISDLTQNARLVAAV